MYDIFDLSKYIGFNERMSNMPNVKALIIKLIFFFSGIALFILTAVLNSFKLISPTTYVANSALLAVPIGLSVLCYIRHNKAIKSSVHIIDIIISFVLFFFIYLIYLIPPFGFHDTLGVNNSLLILFVFVLGAMYLGEIAAVFEHKIAQRRNNAPKKSLYDTQQGNPYKPRISIHFGVTGSLSHRYQGEGAMPNANVFKTVSLIMLVVSIAAAIFNTIYPIIDMTKMILR